MYLALPIISILLFFSCAQVPQSQLEWNRSIDIATGKGTKGSWQQNESIYDYVDDATVALSENTINVAWVDQKMKDVFFQQVAPDGLHKLGNPINISQSPTTFSWIPRIVVAPNVPERILVVWQEIIFSGGSHGGDIMYASSIDNGKTFSRPVNLSRSIGGDGKGRINEEIWTNGSYDIVAGNNGKIVIAWTEYNGPLWVSTSSNYGTSFSKPRIIAGHPGALPARAPALALNAKNEVFLAWTKGEEAKADIMIQKSKNGGTHFESAKIIAKTNGYSDSPEISFDSEGTLHVVFAESMGGPFDQFTVLYSRSKDDAQTFELTKVISNPAPDSIVSSRYPDLSLSGRHIYVSWELYHDVKSDSSGLGMAISSDAGQNFSAPSIIPGSKDPEGGTNGSHQGLLNSKLASNTSGLVSIVNSSLKLNKHSRIWLMTAHPLK
ncbi:MAG TPA: sialidase family protein [Bacteriovoracaceae bacterium]|nr:sialidase family protein [Bacteriovoracaceae bacterium]